MGQRAGARAGFEGAQGDAAALPARRGTVALSCALLRAGALLVPLLIAACRTLPTPPPPPSAEWSARRAQLQALPQFTFSGRVAVVAAGNGFNASLHWVQAGPRSELSLQGPLGIGAVQVLAEGGTLQMFNGRGEPLAAEAARRELSARLGFELPVTSLRYWLLGVPDPAAPAQEELDTAQQRLSALTQQGWHVTYPLYGPAGEGALPVRVTLEREAVRVKLIIDRWQL
ncbi:MAG: outer membrane lipoprotein LolB [Gammaproteobacteria bacterium]|nr:outer membrane lipoprotein LolB [Gammaproteobacteria bacterium]